jgi:hypothetical protein
VSFWLEWLPKSESVVAVCGAERSQSSQPSARRHHAMTVEKASGESGTWQGDSEVTKITFQVNHPPSRPQRGEGEEIDIGIEMRGASCLGDLA